MKTPTTPRAISKMIRKNDIKNNENADNAEGDK